MIGVTDAYSKYMRTPCTPPLLLCLMGTNGVNVRPISGAAAIMQAANVHLYTATTAHLTILAQIFMLKFIKSGLLNIYLPLAIILRSLPFMRQLGGGLLAICFALFIIYPGLLYVESAFWNPYDWIGGTGGETWDLVSDFASDLENDNEPLAYGDLYMAEGTWHFADIGLSVESWDKLVLDVVPELTKMASASFLCSTFLFTFNILAITAAARSFGRLLGADVDLSRLVQIV
jgi:hypothetical protein